MFTRKLSRLALAVLALFAMSCGSRENRKTASTDGFDASKSDPKAIQIVDAMFDAMGGPEAWQKARYLSYHWILEKDGHVLRDFRHDWDRNTNQYRVEGTSRKGAHFVVLFNTQTKEGKAYVEGVEVPSDSLTKWIDQAYGRFINDSYWLLMPYKLKDPGVVLNYDGEKEIDGSLYDVVKVTFENVGLTPKDTYWAFIDKKTRLMKKWEYVLQGQQPPATSAWWKDWQTFGGIKLAMGREFDDRPFRIYFKEIKVSATPSAEIFALTANTF
ncbi:MAG: DUF6503 family protein [bacterium]